MANKRKGAFMSVLKLPILRSPNPLFLAACPSKFTADHDQIMRAIESVDFRLEEKPESKTPQYWVPSLVDPIDESLIEEPISTEMSASLH